jgi:hypothetical protein
MKHYLVVLLGIALGLSVFANQARADLYSRYVESIEWLVDSNDAIAVAKVVEGGEHGKAEIESVLKPVASTDRLAWAIDDIASGLKQLKTGERVLVFAEKQKGKKAYFSYISLTDNASRLPDDKARLDAYFYAVFDFSSPQDVCAVLTKRGALLTDPKELLTYVKQRVKSPARLPPDWDRDDPERLGGFCVTPGCPVDIHETVNHIFVPPDPEYREESLRLALDKNNNGTLREEAVTRLRNWNDPEVVAALKKCLNDDYIATIWINEPGKDSVRKKIYRFRELAYRSLQKMHVSVPAPKLYPE